MRPSTRQITRGALLVSLALVLSLTRLGEIPVPTPARAITITHIPVILAGIVLGPWVGGAVGLIWGVSQFFVYGSAFPDPLVHILPRVAVGVVAAWTFRLVRRRRPQESLATATASAAVAGTVTNTLGVLGLAVWRGYFTGPVAELMGAVNLPLEIMAALIVTIPVVRVLLAQVPTD